MGAGCAWNRWRHAQNHGIAVGRAMAGDPAPYDDVPWFWTDQHGVNLQVAGLPAEAARTIVRADAARRSPPCISRRMAP